MDLYKELGNALQKNIFGEWEKVTVKIESSLKKNVFISGRICFVK